MLPFLTLRMSSFLTIAFLPKNGVWCNVLGQKLRSKPHVLHWKILGGIPCLVFYPSFINSLEETVHSCTSYKNHLGARNHSCNSCGSSDLCFGKS